MLKYAVALVGPGETGALAADRATGGSAASHLRRFAWEVSPGDAVILRLGRYEALAVGEVVGEYEYLPQFEDVGGIDLRHARRVRWHAFSVAQGREHGVPAAGNAPFSPTTAPALTSLAKARLADGARAAHPSALPALPQEEPTVEDRRPAVGHLVAEARDLWEIYRDRQRFGDPPSERELMAHLVVPLLRSLGWRTEQIAMEWKRIDVALFRSLPRTAANLHLVLEGKKTGELSSGTLKQAREYLEALGVDRDVVVTDGFTYRRYDGTAEYRPAGYLNLIRLKAAGVELLDVMSPTHSSEGV